ARAATGRQGVRAEPAGSRRTNPVAGRGWCQHDNRTQQGSSPEPLPTPVAAGSLPQEDVAARPEAAPGRRYPACFGCLFLCCCQPRLPWYSIACVAVHSCSKGSHTGVPSAKIWHFGTQLGLALGTLALSSVWHLALWHSARFGTWHFGTWVFHLR